MNKLGTLIVFSAASGAGKSTLLAALESRIDDMAFSISTTTRKPRGNEQEGVEYHFIAKAAFEKKIEQGVFVEWAEVHGNYYGTSKEDTLALLKQGKTVVMDIDVQGKVQIDRHFPQAHGIFIEAPSWDELENRLRSRGTEDEMAIQKRLSNARKENEFARFEGKYSYFVVNDDLEATVSKVERIITQIKENSGGEDK